MTPANNDTVVEKAVIEWLKAELYLDADRSIGPHTRINIDLGVAGDDGMELITAFGRKFSVDIELHNWTQYFGHEASATPLTLLKSLSRRLQGKAATDLPPLYVSYLARLACESRK